jgi:hypothetical protein
VIWSTSFRLERRELCQVDRLGQLRMCQDVSTHWRHEGHLSDSASPIRCMCFLVGRCSWANLMMKILGLFSRVERALPGTFQLIDWNVCFVQLLRSWGHCSRFGLHAASRNWLANLCVIVSPWMVRLAWEGLMNAIIFYGSA